MDTEINFTLLYGFIRRLLILLTAVIIFLQLSAILVVFVFISREELNVTDGFAITLALMTQIVITVIGNLGVVKENLCLTITYTIITTIQFVLSFWFEIYPECILTMIIHVALIACLTMFAYMIPFMAAIKPRIPYDIFESVKE